MCTVRYNNNSEEQGARARTPPLFFEKSVVCVWSCASTREYHQQYNNTRTKSHNQHVIHSAVLERAD